MSKLILERRKCIGCGSCSSICPKYFKLSDDGKGALKGENITSKDGLEERQLEEIEECVQQAADACPVQCIYIKK